MFETIEWSDEVDDCGGLRDRAIFWVVATCGLVKFTDVSDVLAVSIIRATYNPTAAQNVYLCFHLCDDSFQFVIIYIGGEPDKPN
jgi:hypothetical protein